MRHISRERLGVGPLPSNNSTLTSRISAIQPVGGVIVVRGRMAAPLTRETALRAMRTKEANLNMARERGKTSGGLEGVKR